MDKVSGMRVKRVVAYICIFAAFVLIVLAAALPLYKNNAYDGKSSVITGSDGFLFWASGDGHAGIDGFAGRDLYTDGELDSVVSALADISKRAGGRSLFITVPSKMAVYRDKLPRSVAELYSENRKYTQLFSALSSRVDVIDLTECFEKYAKDELLYNTADDTLNELGGYRLIEKAAEQLNSSGTVKLRIPPLSDYTLSYEEDEKHALTREYRNETGITVKNKTVILTEKSINYKPADGYGFEATTATYIPGANELPAVYAADTNAGAYRKFLSAAASPAVFVDGISADETVVSKASAGLSLFIITEDGISALPSARNAAPQNNDGVSVAPVILDTTYSDAGKFVIYGAAESGAVVTAYADGLTVSDTADEGTFMLELTLPKGKAVEITLTALTPGKEVSEKTSPVAAKFSGKYGYKNVITGKLGHLHLDQTVNDFTGQTALDGDTLAQYVNYLNAKADRIHSVSANTKIVYVIAPNHLTVYPETSPDDIAENASDTTRLTQFIKAFEKSDKITFIDLVTPLTNAKKYAPYRLYNKTDTHWNELGAYYASYELLEFISNYHPSAAPEPLTSYNVYTRITDGGDMAKHLGFDLHKVTENGVFVRSRSPLFSGIEKDHTMNFDNVWFKDRREFSIEGELPTMIMYRDSFSTNMMSFLADKFSKSIFHEMWDYPEELELYAQMQPDYIIYEYAERNLFLIN